MIDIDACSGLFIVPLPENETEHLQDNSDTGPIAVK